MQAAFGELRLKNILRLLAPLLILVACMVLLSRQVTPELWQDLPQRLSSISIEIWVAALAFTALSFLAVGRYDGAAHRHLQTGITNQQARISGMAAVAVAQSIGFGLFSGALARWRLLPGISLTQSLGLSAFVSISFVVAWGVITALVCLVLPAPSWTVLPSLLGLLALPFVGFAMFRWPVLRMRRAEIRLPSFRLSRDILFWTFVDTAAAGAALWLLLPASADISFLAFLPLYLIALGTALISNTPGGVGPFELVLIGVLPHVPADALIQSVIAFRVVYYAAPACLGFLVLLRPLKTQVSKVVAPDLDNTLWQADRSEVAIIRQNGGRLARTDDGVVALWPTAQTVTGMFAPVSGSIGTMMSQVVKAAAESGRLPILYKLSARHAQAARRLGWSVVHLADDAVLAPDSFSIDVPARRTLRRKLRACAKAGVSVAVPAHLPMRVLADIDAEWCDRHGPARGGTMGRFSPEYVKTQWLAIAYIDAKPVAYVSFFMSRDEWALDLMRQTKDAPDGTMHSLVLRAITEAKSNGVKTVSLAATPACPDPDSAIWRAIAKHVVNSAGGPGLRQFKSAFAPAWVPRYAAAPGKLGLALGLADIAREVHHPTPLDDDPSNAVHYFDEYYELDSRKRA